MQTQPPCVASSITNGLSFFTWEVGSVGLLRGLTMKKCLELEPAGGKKAVHLTVALASEMKGTPDICVQSPWTHLPDLK